MGTANNKETAHFSTCYYYYYYYYYYYSFNTLKRQRAKPKNTYNTMLKNCYKLLQITSNGPFKTLPHLRLYFSPRSYHQITVNIHLTCQRIHVSLYLVASHRTIGLLNTISFFQNSNLFKLAKNAMGRHLQ